MRKLLLGLVVLWSLSVSAQPTGPASARTITVGVTASPDMALLIVAVKGGFLQKEGVNARLQLFDSSPAILQGVVAGLADISINTEPAQLGVRARGGKIVQVMTGNSSGRGNGVVVDTKHIREPSDLIGKTIAVHRGTGSHYHLVYFLEKNSIPKEKLSIKFMEAPDQVAALARGDIQAFFSWEPYLSRAIEAIPQAKVLSRAIDDGFSFNGNVIMREEMARAEKDTAVKIVKGLIAASSWIAANPMEAARVCNEVLNAPSIEIVNQQMQYYSYPANFMREGYAQQVRMAEWGSEIGLFPVKSPKALVDELMYSAIIKEAAASRTDF